MTLRHIILPTVLLLATAGCAGAQQYQYNTAPQGYPVAPQDTAITSVDQFYAPLAPFGRWVNSQWGRAWVPNVDRDWRPYTVGQWIDDPQYGWTWGSDEPWGWATYHYGRWGYDQRLGWVWVPGLEWAPAWVAWRDGDDVTGWAPLPPQVSYGLAFGVGALFDSWGYDQWYAPAWVYAPRATFYYPYGRRETLPWQRGRDYWNHTRGATHYDRDDGRIVNRSMDNVRPRPGGQGYDPRGQWNGDRNHGDTNRPSQYNQQDQYHGGGARPDGNGRPPAYGGQGRPPYDGQQRPQDNGRPASNGQHGEANDRPVPPVRPGHPDTPGYAGQGANNGAYPSGHGQSTGQPRPNDSGRPPQYGQPGGQPDAGQPQNNGGGRPSPYGQPGGQQHGGQQPGGQQHGGQPAPQDNGTASPYGQHGNRGGQPGTQQPAAVPVTPPAYSGGGGNAGGHGGRQGGAPVAVAPPANPGGGNMRPVAPVTTAPVPQSNARPVAPKPADDKPQARHQPGEAPQ